MGVSTRWIDREPVHAPVREPGNGAAARLGGAAVGLAVLLFGKRCWFRRLGTDDCRLRPYRS